MGCGSILGDLFYLADSMLENRQPLEHGWQDGQPVAPDYRHSSPVPPPENNSPLAQLYNMYGEGRVSKEVFSALKALADRGQLRQEDLAVHCARAKQFPTHKKDVEVANALRGIRSRLGQLERTRETSAGVLIRLESRLQQLDLRMTGKEQAARQSVARDEETARQRLAEKQGLNSSYERLSSQAQALRDDLARLDDLRIQLDAKMAELEALQARGELAKISITKE